VSPGPLLTGIFAKAAGMDPAEADRTAAILEPVFVARLQSWQPIRRAADPSDMAPAILWLARDAAAFVNGQDVTVDGGISAGRPGSVSAADRAAHHVDDYVNRACSPRRVKLDSNVHKLTTKDR